MSYTPGPWKVDIETGYGDDDVPASRYETLLGISGDEGTIVIFDQSYPPTKDNADLLAAAPDMHYALAIALEVIKHADPLNERYPESRKIVVDALTKAAGLEPG